MFKVKNIAVAAICGFVLSFLISIISTHRPGVSLLRGLIFALVFAALAAAISLLDSKFLETESMLGTDSTDDNSAGSAKRTSSGNGSAGSLVNITIDDENLTEDEQAPAFDVSSGRQIFSYKPAASAANGPANSSAAASVTSAAESSVNTKDIKDTRAEVNAGASPSAVADSSAENAFTPVNLGKPLESGEESKIVNKAPSQEAKSSGGAGTKESVKEIDALPDIGEFAISDNDTGDSGAASEVINDSDFAQSGDTKASAAMTEGGDMMKQDSKIIASAIRTLLKKDE